jgi:hypothetical protein
MYSSRRKLDLSPGHSEPGRGLKRDGIRKAEEHLYDRLGRSQLYADVKGRKLDGIELLPSMRKVSRKHAKAYLPCRTARENCFSLLHRLCGVLDRRSRFVPSQRKQAMQVGTGSDAESSLLFKYPLTRIDAENVVDVIMPEECMCFDVKRLRHEQQVEYLREHTCGASSTEGSYLTVSMGDQILKDGTRQVVVESAHRIVLWSFVGPPAGDQAVAMHLCDNKACLNPKHLFWGTIGENNQAARLRGDRVLQLKHNNAIRAASGRLAHERHPP